MTKWIAEGGSCHEAVNLHNKIAIITGGNTGIGKTAAYHLATMGCHIVIACRDQTKGEESVHEIRHRAKHYRHYLRRYRSLVKNNEQFEGSVEYMPLDLAELASIQKFTKMFEKKHKYLNLLICNAGVMMCPYATTKDGFELQFGTNHLGHFLLASSLLPLLKQQPNSRVVCVSGVGHNFTPSSFSVDDFFSSNPKHYSPSKAYAFSKLANILFAKQLQKKLENNAIAVSLHPGTVRTELFRHIDGGRAFVIRVFHHLLMKDVEQGTQTTLYCCVHPDIVPGGFYADCRECPTSSAAKDEKLAYELWDRSVKATSKWHS